MTWIKDNSSIGCFNGILMICDEYKVHILNKTTFKSFKRKNKRCLSI